ncbi:MAG TPA: hypothetical protein VFV02_11570 [Acidimicrobiales bacterium]|nr:hypothetical protein [Acidimicrobiales bacterium]
MATGDFELVSNDGHPIRSIPPARVGGCRAVRWWSTKQILGTCGNYSLSSRPTPWLLPVDGSSPSPLFEGGTLAGGAIVSDAWQLSTGVYATSDRCFDLCLGRLQASGDLADIPVPSQISGTSSSILGGFENRLAVFGHSPEPAAQPGYTQAAGFLDWVDPETDAVTPLLGGSVNGGSVNVALMHEPSVPADAPASSPSPHFDTPEAAMTYLASAWNHNDLVALDHVTDPAARAALQAMHNQAVNLRLNHCTPRPQGDYLCAFDHDYPAGTSTTLAGGTGHAEFLVGPAATPGWYLTVFQGCS